MKEYNHTGIQKFCENHERVVDNMIWKTVQNDLHNIKIGVQKMFSLFKMNREDNAIYLMFVNVHRKDEENVHCDIVSITKYENAAEYNRHVDLVIN